MLVHDLRPGKQVLLCAPECHNNKPTQCVHLNEAARCDTCFAWMGDTIEVQQTVPRQMVWLRYLSRQVQMAHLQYSRSNNSPSNLGQNCWAIAAVMAHRIDLPFV
jgi:hypothetical protein